MNSWWKKYRFLAGAMATVLVALGSIGFMLINLEGMERGRTQEYSSFADKISRSAMNFVMDRQYDNLLDMLRLLTSTSSICYMVLYMNETPFTQAGNAADIPAAFKHKPPNQDQWIYSHGSNRYFIKDIHLPFHPDLLPGRCVLRIVFSLKEFLARKDSIQLAIAVIIVLMLALTLAFYFLARAEVNKSKTIREIAHDARKVLNRIAPRLDNIYTQLLQQQDLVALPRNIKLTWEEAIALSRFIDNLNDHENISQGNISRNFGAKDVVHMLKRKQQQFEVTLAKEGKTLQLDLPIQELEIWTDEHYLERILVNLIDNAIKFSSVRTVVEIRLEIKSEWITIEVQDQGPGIPAKYWAHVFKPFKRLHSDKPGSGLGLSNARALARVLGGEVGIRQSEIGKGTTFYLRLPQFGPKGIGRMELKK